MSLRQMMTAALAAVLVVGVMGTMNMLHGQSGPAGGTTIAVVDVAEVFENLEERGVIEADIRDKITAMQKWEQTKAAELTGLQSDMDIMDPNSDGFKKAIAELERKTIALRIERDVRQRKIQREMAQSLEGLYRKVVDGIGVVAAAEGYDLVLTKDRTPSLENASQQQILGMIQLRKTLYSNPQMDITQRVKTKLNNDYNNTPQG